MLPARIWETLRYVHRVIFIMKMYCASIIPDLKISMAVFLTDSTGFFRVRFNDNVSLGMQYIGVYIFAVMSQFCTKSWSRYVAHMPLW